MTRRELLKGATAAAVLAAVGLPALPAAQPHVVMAYDPRMFSIRAWAEVEKDTYWAVQTRIRGSKPTERDWQFARRVLLDRVHARRLL